MCSTLLLQDNQLHAFGRPTYGRLGRDDVGASSDDAVAEAKLVSNLEGVSVAGMAAGESCPLCLLCLCAT